MRKLTALINNRWAYVTIPDGFTWQVTPQRQATGFQVRVYRGAGKAREIVALFHVNQIREEGTIEFDFNHPENDKTVIKDRMAL